MGSLAEAYRRWRHTRGFGVHSAFAFFVLTDIVRCPYEYYAHNDLVHLASDYADLQDARILLRLAARLPFKAVCVEKEERSKVIVKAIKSANSKLRICSAKELDKVEGPVLAYSRRDNTDFSPLLNRCDGSAIFQRKRGNYLLPTQKDGVCFHGKKHLLCISRPGMQHVAYSINF